MIKRIADKIQREYKKIKHALSPRMSKFDATGERVDIVYKKRLDFEAFDMYQKSHYKRYEYALTIIGADSVCGDFACGTGYGSVMLAEKAKNVTGADINAAVVSAIQKRYKNVKNVQFINADLLDLAFNSEFDNIVSFETIEHFAEENILKLLPVFNNCLKANGKLIISTPYKQEKSEGAISLGHHLTFYIDEKTVTNWLDAAGFDVVNISYQNYDTHVIKARLEKKDFIICEAKKK